MPKIDNHRSQEHPPKNITTKVVRGGAWVYGRMLATNILNLGVMAILARQLTPAEFGLVALASVILRFLVVIGSQGINEFVIYDNQTGRENRVQAAFWMDLAFSGASVLLGFILLPWITNFYNEPGLSPILVAMLLRYPVDSLSKIPDALIKKKLDFRKLEIRDTVLDVFSSVTSVVLALSGFGIWSLVVPGLVKSPIRAFIVFKMVSWRPGWNLNLNLWPRIFSFSASVIGSTLTSFMISEGDTLIIGKLMGSQVLGIYNLAWQSANLVGRIIVNISNKLSLPALSAVSDDLDRLRSGFQRILRFIATVSFPLLIGLFVIADDFILLVYGPQWEQSILPTRILILYALRYVIGSTTGSVYKALGRPDIDFKLGLVIVPFYLGSIWFSRAFGIVGVAVAVTFVRTVFGFADFWIVARQLRISLIKLFQPVLPALWASCWMGSVVFSSKLIWEIWLPSNCLPALIVLVVIGGITYLLLLRTVYNELARDLSKLSAQLFGQYQKVINKVLRVT